MKSYLDKFIFCLIIAEDIVNSVKQQYPNSSGVMGGGDPAARSPTQTTADVLQAYTKYLPDFMQALGSQLKPFAQAQLGAQQATGPANVALSNQLGQQLQQGQATSDLATLQGPGGQLVRQTQDLQKQIDPQYYRGREEAGSQLSNLLNSIDVNKLSGSERSEVERSLGQSNASRGLETPTSTSTVENAMTYGSALQAKRNALSQALNTATGFLPAAKSGFDVLQTGLGRTSQTPQTAGGFGNVQQGIQSGQGIFGPLAGFGSQANDINANRRDVIDRISGASPNISV